MRRAAEDRFSEGAQGDLLSEEVLVRGQQRGLADSSLKAAVCGKIATVESKEEFAKPGVGGGGEAVENGVQEELAEIIDRG